MRRRAPDHALDRLARRRPRADRRGRRPGQAARWSGPATSSSATTAASRRPSCPGTSRRRSRRRIDAEIGTTDGSHPPALRRVDLDFDKTHRLDAMGLPACRQGQLEARTTAAAKKACPDAIVGSGEGEVEVAFPEQAPFSAKGPIVLFNGGVQGGTTHRPRPRLRRRPGADRDRRHGQDHPHPPRPLRPPHRGRGSRRSPAAPARSPSSSSRRPQLHLPGQEAELPHRQLPDRRLLRPKGKATFSDGTTLGVTHVFPCTPQG